MSKPLLSVDYDVVISGAGPVGLFLACELALAKCSVLVLEKAEQPHAPLKQLPFGIRGLSAPSIEALYRRGLLDALEVPKRLKDPHTQLKAVQGGPPPPRQVGHFAGIPFHESNIDGSRWQSRLPSSPETHLIAEMQELESVLARRAEALGVHIKRGFAVTGFAQTDGEVRTQAGEHVCTSGWLVGCDGSRSVVRKVGGFDFAGTEPEFTGYSTKIDLQDPEKLSPGRNLTARGMYMQSQPGYVVLQDFDGGAGHGTEALTRERVQEVLRRISGTDVSVTALHFASTWTDRARQSTTYRNNRVLLAGDAAHIHSPLGGQGLNLGLGDAMNLGWKLASVIRHGAPTTLLDTYERERHPVGAQVLDWSRAQVSIMRPTPEARAMNTILRDLMSLCDVATYFAGRVWGVETHYDLGDAHPLVGHSVPNFELEDGTRIGTLMHDAPWLWLDFTGKSALQALTKPYAGRLKYVAGRAKVPLGVYSALVRPDGYVAWASGAETDAALVKELLADKLDA